MFKVNKIYVGDNVKVMADIPDNFIDLTVTSPPYDNMRTYNGYTFDFEGVANQLYRVTKPGGVVVWVVNDATVNGSETGTSFRQALYFKEIGFNLHDTMIWNKGGFTAVGAIVSRYGQVFEYMFVLSKGKPKTFNPFKDKPNKKAGDKQRGTIRQKDGSMRLRSNIGRVRKSHGIRFNIWDMFGVNGKERTGHPAQYPESLARDHILSWSNPGDIVLDPFSGSGTTAVIAKQQGREYIGIDISQEYCDIANQRLKQTSIFSHI